VKFGVGVEVGHSAEVPVELPIAFSATLWIGLRLGGVTMSGSEPRTVCHWPPPNLYSAARQGPTSRLWARHPRSGRRSRGQLAVGPTGGDQFQHSPLDLILYF
jgi:hypothetical protein